MVGSKVKKASRSQASCTECQRRKQKVIYSTVPLAFVQGSNSAAANGLATTARRGRSLIYVDILKNNHLCAKTPRRRIQGMCNVRYCQRLTDRVLQKVIF